MCGQGEHVDLVFKITLTIKRIFWNCQPRGRVIEAWIAWEVIVQHKRIPGGISLCKRSKHAASGWAKALENCRNMYQDIKPSQIQGSPTPWLSSAIVTFFVSMNFED